MPKANLEILNVLHLRSKLDHLEAKICYEKLRNVKMRKIKAKLRTSMVKSQGLAKKTQLCPVKQRDFCIAKRQKSSVVNGLPIFAVVLELSSDSAKNYHDVLSSLPKK